MMIMMPLERRNTGERYRMFCSFRVGIILLLLHKVGMDMDSRAAVIDDDFDLPDLVGGAEEGRK